MFKKLKILTLLQLSDRVKIKKNQTIPQKLGSIGKTLLGIGVSFGIFCALFYVIFNLISLRHSLELLTMLTFLMQLLSVISCTLSLSSTLYVSKDNQMLMTYPVKHIYIYISKLVVEYIMELKKSLIFTFPLFMAYGLIARTNEFGAAAIPLLADNPFYSVYTVYYTFILPLFPVLIGAIISIVIVYGGKLLKKFDIAKIIATLALFAGLFVVCNFIIDALPDKIRLLAEWSEFNNKVEILAKNIQPYTFYNKYIGNSLYAAEYVKETVTGLNGELNIVFTLKEGLLLGFKNFGFVNLALVILLVVAIAISLPVFFKLASSANEHSIDKQHAAKNVVHKSTFFTFMRKELTLSVRNIGDFSSNYLFLFILPFVLLIMSAIYVRVYNRNDLGYSMTYGFIGLISLIMLSASNTASATAISSEGSEFALLKTAPGKTSNIVWAKILINAILSFISLTITFVLLSIYLKDQVVLGNLWLVYAFVLLVDIGLILWSIQLDILNPNMKEYANSQNIGDIKNFSTSILIGVVVSVLFSAVLILVYVLSANILINAIILILLALLFDGGRLYMLINYINAYFHDIEY